MLPRPAIALSSSQRRSRSSPMSKSRRASRPTTKKKRLISPELIHSCTVSERRRVSNPTVNLACHTAS